MPLISVIVPVYKVEKYLRRCIDSILGQSFGDFELILVDDGSPDRCGEICEEYAKKDNRIVVIHKENGGLSDARNKGIDWLFAHSNSEWITFIDSDDWVHKQYLELLYRAAIDHGVKIVSCGYLKVFDGQQLCESVYTNTDRIEGEMECLLREYRYSIFNIITAWGRIYQRSLFTQIRYPVGHFFEDSYTTWKLYCQCEKIALIKCPLYFYYQNESGIISSDMSVLKMQDTFDSYLEKIDYFASSGHPYLFDYFLRDYCKKIERYYKIYKTQKQYKKILLGHKQKAAIFIKKYSYLMSAEFKKYGYKKWYREDYKILEAKKRDFESVKQEKGTLYALLWRIKQVFFKAKR